MFELTEAVLTQEVLLLPAIVGLWLLFDFMGSLIFGRGV